MGETVFEKYKEALRVGHVASLRGRLEDAANAYREAISITPDRAVPRTALGRVLMQLGDAQGALDAFDGALVLEPRDDASLAGRAQALAALDRTADAALAQDELTLMRLAQDRRTEAAESARRALAFERPEGQREIHDRLAEALTVPAAVAAPDLAEALVDGPVADGSAAPPVDGIGHEPDVPYDLAVERPTGPPETPVDPEALIVAFEEAAARGDAESAAAAALAAARAYRADGRGTASIDACLQGIGVRPGHIDLHLLLADLAFDRGWTGEAEEAHRQLLRLAELDGDAAAAELVRGSAAGRLAGNADAATD